MNRIGNQFSMYNAVASQLVRHNLPRLALMPIEQMSKKALCSLAITPVLEKHIDHFTILVHRPP